MSGQELKISAVGLTRAQIVARCLEWFDQIAADHVRQLETRLVADDADPDAIDSLVEDSQAEWQVARQKYLATLHRGMTEMAPLATEHRGPAH
jgi:hypothetical protein